MKSENKVINTLFEQFHKPLILYCVNKGLTKTEAEDVVSEAFYRFFEKYDRLKDLDRNQQKKWLYSAVNNIFHDELRYKKNIVSDMESDELDNISDKNNEIDNFIEDQAFKQMKKKYENELSENERLTLQIAYELSLGSTYKELQIKYGLPIPTLKTKTKRLRDKSIEILAKILKK